MLVLNLLPCRLVFALFDRFQRTFVIKSTSCMKKKITERFTDHMAPCICTPYKVSEICLPFYEPGVIPMYGCNVKKQYTCR